MLPTVESDSENRSRGRRACNLPGLTVRAPAALYIVPGRRTFLSTSIRPEWPSIAPSVERAVGGGYAAASLFLFSFNSSGAAETWMSYYFGPADYFSDGYLDGAAQGAMHSHNLGAGCADGQYRLSVRPSDCLAGTYSAKSEARQGQILSFALYLWARVSLKTSFLFFGGVWCWNGMFLLNRVIWRSKSKSWVAN